MHPICSIRWRALSATEVTGSGVDARLLTGTVFDGKCLGYLRGNKLSSGVWDSCEEIVDACAEAWNWLMADLDRIRSMGTREWVTVSV